MRVQKELKYSKFVWLKKANKKTLARIESVARLFTRWFMKRYFNRFSGNPGENEFALISGDLGSGLI